MKIKCLYFFSILLILISCDHSNKAEQHIIFTQGIITQIEANFKYSNKFTYNYTYVYYLSRKTPFIGVQKNSKLIFSEDEPVIISVSKMDSLDSFIESRGIINK